MIPPDITYLTYLIVQTETFSSFDGDLYHNQQTIAEYKDFHQACHDLALYIKDAYRFNQDITENDQPVIAIFPGNSTIYTLVGRTYSLEEKQQY